MVNYSNYRNSEESEIANKFFSVVDGKTDISNVNEKCLYAIKFADRSMKIGVSFYPKRSIRNIALSSARNIENIFISSVVANPYEIEKQVREYIEPLHISGDSYRINFNKVVGKICQLAKREKRHGY